MASDHDQHVRDAITQLHAVKAACIRGLTTFCVVQIADGFASINASITFILSRHVRILMTSLQKKRVPLRNLL